MNTESDNLSSTNTKTVMITGASAGIGKAMAKHLNSVGYRVVLIARNADKLAEVAKNLTADTLCIKYDLQNLNDIESIFKECQSKGVKLYGLVHCAGINRDQPLRTNRLQDMIDVMNLNLLSFVELVKYFSHKKYSEDNGSIVAMSSSAVYTCNKSTCTYSASKAGVDAAVRVMSKELVKRRIRVNSIQPTYVNTEMARSTPNFEEKFAAVPLGVIEPEYVAYLAEFLLSDKSKYISGSNIKMACAE